MNLPGLSVWILVPVIMLTGCAYHVPPLKTDRAALHIHGTDAEHHSAKILIVNVRPQDVRSCRQHGNHWHCARG